MRGREQLQPSSRLAPLRLGEVPVSVTLSVGDQANLTGDPAREHGDDPDSRSGRTGSAPSGGRGLGKMWGGCGDVGLAKGGER